MHPGDLLTHPPRFTDGVRVLFLKGRHKDGVEKQRTITRVSHEADEFQVALSELCALAAPNERIYASADPRNTCAAARVFKHALIDAEYSPSPALFYSRLTDRWSSALMQPTSRARKSWLFDCDEVGQAEAIAEVADSAGVETYRYHTKNGEHLITATFDRRLLPAELVKIMKPNAMMLWAW